jgi:SAM-dependent methyltransferase
MTGVWEHDISDGLRRFCAEAPLARGAHLPFLRRAAASLGAGDRILDVGAGLSPYRELFAHAKYISCDWDQSGYEPQSPPDIVAAADHLPVADGSFAAVLCTQVLEHVPEPGAVVAEFHRILRAGGRVWLTAPLVWCLHEEPHDYYRYTSHGLQYLFKKAGFVDIEVTPLTDSFTSVAQLVGDLGWMAGQPADELAGERAVVAETMRRLADVVASFSRYDVSWLLPLDYSVMATRP